MPLQGGGHVEEADSTLSGKCRPDDLSTGFNLEPRIAQFKPHTQLLARTHCSHDLNANAPVGKIADNAAIRLIQSDVGECAQFVPMMRSRLPRWEIILRPYAPPEVLRGRRLWEW